MDDQTLAILCSNFDQAITLSPRDTDTNADETLETPKENSGKLESNSDLVDTSGASDDTHETLQVIRKEHARLCNEVKGMSADSLLGSEAVTALQNLSTEYKLLKSKYHEECELLKKKYLEECSERKKLYNEVIELKGNIRVFCRCRPLKQCGLLRNCVRQSLNRQRSRPLSDNGRKPLLKRFFGLVKLRICIT
ncbi:hypothetical protein OROGR_018036 [Orobanche gracilis]